MRILEGFVAGALGLIALYLIVTAANVNTVISGLANGGATLIGALQGKGAGAYVNG